MSNYQTLPSQLWHGDGRTWSGVLRLIGAAVILLVGRLLWGTAVRLAHFPPPTKTLGVVIAVIACVVFLWGFWALWQAIKRIGGKRIGIALILVFLAVVALGVTGSNNDDSLPGRIPAQFLDTGEVTVDGVKTVVLGVVNAPKSFLFAYQNQRQIPTMPPGLPTPDAEATPIRAVAVPAGSNPPVVTFTKQATVTPTNQTTEIETAVTPTTSLEKSTYELQFQIDANSNVRAGPGTEHDVIGFVSQGEVYAILEIDSPQNWYKIELSSGELGWIGTSRGSVHSP